MVVNGSKLILLTLKYHELAHTFVEIDRDIIYTAILLPTADSRRDVVSYQQKNVHEVLVNRLVKLVQGKSVVR